MLFEFDKITNFNKNFYECLINQKLDVLPVTVRCNVIRIKCNIYLRVCFVFSLDRSRGLRTYKKHGDKATRETKRTSIRTIAQDKH